MKHSYTAIKNMAKDRLGERFGDALLIVLIPSLLVFVITLFTGIITSFLGASAEFLTDNLIRVILNIGSSFITTFMIVKYVRFRDGFTFKGVFDNPKLIIQFFIFSIITTLITFLALLPLFHSTIALYPVLVSSTDPNTIRNAVGNYIINNPEIINNVFYSAVLLIIFWLIMVKLRFTTYLIVDKELTAFKAMKKSWELTRGNYLRVFFFPITFFFWFVLGFFTCGLAYIYVIPLVETGYAFLYTSILKEQGEDDPLLYKHETDTEHVDPLDFY